MTEPLRRGAAVAPGYEVVAHLHRGRTLDVYDAWSEERGSRCVVKTLRPDRLDDVRASRALLREGRLLRRLAHPHLVRSYETVAAPQPVVVLETLTGQTVAHMIETGPPLGAPELALLGLHLASALGYLHRHGYVHLDVKPSNVVVEDGRAKLIDLSLARRPGRGRRGVGTWCYLAPEQATGAHVGPPADVWGLGALLWEAAAGEPLFDDDGALPTDSDEPVRFYPQLERDARPVPRRRRLPRPLVEAIEASLRRDPAQRPPLDELAAVLAAVEGAPDLRAPAT